MTTSACDPRGVLSGRGLIATVAAVLADLAVEGWYAPG